MNGIMEIRVIREGKSHRGKEATGDRGDLRGIMHATKRGVRKGCNVDGRVSLVVARC